MPTATKAVEDLFAKISREAAAPSDSNPSGTAAAAAPTKTQPPLETFSLFVGQHESGKSSLLALLQSAGGLSGKDDKPKPTVALEYMFARRTGSANGAKDVAHIWELGGGMNLKQLVGVPITPSRLPFAVVGIVVDLSDPSNVLPSLAHWIKVLRSHVSASFDALQERDPAAADALLENARARFSEDHPDRRVVDPFPVPLLILANKYDLFKNNESMKKKVICQALRFFAHTHGATLLFVSTREKGLQNNFRSLITQQLFRKAEKQSSELSSDKPLAVPAGSDTFDSILKTLPAGTTRANFVGGKADDVVTMWTRSVEEYFGPASSTEMDEAEADEEEMQNDHPEPRVDEMHQARLEALRRYRKEAERKLKMEEKAKRDTTRTAVATRR